MLGPVPLQVPLSSLQLQRQPMRSEPTGPSQPAQPSDTHSAGGM